MWDVANLQCVATLAGHSGAVRALAACADKVFSGSDDTTIKVSLVAALHSSARQALQAALEEHLAPSCTKSYQQGCRYVAEHCIEHTEGRMHLLHLLPRECHFWALV